MKSNIVLIGFMGTGKSTIGKKLAKHLNKKFIETDTLIEEKTGRTIPDIFAESEILFREYEIQIAKELSKQTDLVISTGGGFVLNKINIDLLKPSSEIILLEAPAKVIFQRIMTEGKEKRPLLNKPDPLNEIQQLLKKRKPFYDIATDIHINTSQKNIPQLVNQILEKISNPNHESRFFPEKQSLNSDNKDNIFSGFKEANACFICRKTLEKVDSLEELKCNICNQPHLAYEICPDGHYVCDQCFSSDFAQYLQQFANTNNSKNPIEIAKEILKYPKLMLNGPEITMIVACALLIGVKNRQSSTQKNKFGMVNIPRIIIAIKRAAVLPGYLTAYYGIDNVAIGVGIALSVFLESTPKRLEDIEHANRCTAQVLEVIQFGTMNPKDAIFKALEHGLKYFQVNLQIE